MLNTLDVVQTTVTSAEEDQKTIEQVIYDSIVEARSACGLHGDSSKECAVAWDIVEELQAERSHRSQDIQIKTSLDQYCFLNPEAAECRVYDV
ncbi:MAG: Calvin cycle protein CP12 [Calothrix sp. C42_A2020_038]|nr:Calvin cycle protein CP12 [Calothrix sp. C42_A2020_038]